MFFFKKKLTPLHKHHKLKYTNTLELDPKVSLLLTPLNIHYCDFLKALIDHAYLLYNINVQSYCYVYFYVILDNIQDIRQIGNVVFIPFGLFLAVIKNLGLPLSI